MNGEVPGTVVLWNADRGFGFVRPDSAGPDIFLHARALHPLGLGEVAIGQRLAFSVSAARRGRIEANAVRLLDPVLAVAQGGRETVSR